jgi:hypothetical protein
MSERLLEPTFLLFCLGAVLFLCAILTAFTGWMFFRIRRQEQKLSLFFSGKEARDLEQVLLEEKETVAAMDGEIQELFDISNRLHQLGARSLHRTAVSRFNPFKESGGNQSFAVALLDGKNTGVVLSSLHTREGTRVFAKPVKHGEPDGYPFTEEEKAVIREAAATTIEKKI